MGVIIHAYAVLMMINLYIKSVAFSFISFKDGKDNTEFTNRIGLCD